ncbi:MAG: GNAT family N-acetyltransferase [Marinirhabdus sp.]
MTIRYAKKEDMPQIIPLCAAHAAYEKAAYDSTDKAAALSRFIFGETPAVTCLVVAQGKVIVGYATFMKQFSTWDAGPYLYLDCLFLKETVRGKGLGTRVMKKIMECAKLENCEMIQWQTPDFNTRAIDFYRKMGGVSKTKERFSLKV